MIAADLLPNTSGQPYRLGGSHARRRLKPERACPFAHCHLPRLSLEGLPIRHSNSAMEATSKRYQTNIFATPADRPDACEARPNEQKRLQRQLGRATPGCCGWISSVDHKSIGLRYIYTAFFFLIVGGIEALIMRVQLARPNQTVLTPEQYNQLFTMHGLTMIFLYASADPVRVFQLSLAADAGRARHGVSAPERRLYWFYIGAGIFLYSSFPVRAGAQWRLVQLRAVFYDARIITRAQYRRLCAGNDPARHLDYGRLGQFCRDLVQGARTRHVDQSRAHPGVGNANGVGGEPTGCSRRQPRLLSAVDGPQLRHAFLRCRERGQAGAVAASVLDLRASLGLRDRAAGDGHRVRRLPTFCRRPLVGYTAVALATMATMLFGFEVWIHHMFAAGLPTLALSFFGAASMLIAIPSAVAVFAWIATIWLGGRCSRRRSCSSPAS